jgi:hypothetical protein
MAVKRHVVRDDSWERFATLTLIENDDRLEDLFRDFDLIPPQNLKI